MRRKRRQSIGASSGANSLRIQGGMLPGPYALFVLREERTLRTLRQENIGRDIGLEREESGGERASESSKVELAENKEPKREALSDGETAIVPSDRKSGGKLDFLQKLLRTFLARHQKALLEGEEERLSHFF